MCCLQPMPDRRLDPDVTIPPQKCIITFLICCMFGIFKKVMFAVKHIVTCIGDAGILIVVAVSIYLKVLVSAKYKLL